MKNLHQALFQQARAAHQAGNPAALRLIDQAISLAPRAAAYHDVRMQVLLALGRADEAVAAGQRAVRLEPKSAAFWFNLGSVLLRVRRAQEAVKSFRAALRLQPGTALVHLNLGSAFSNCGEWALAEASFAEATRLEPGNLVAWGLLAQARAQQDNLAGALACYQAALRAEPGYIPALSKLAETLCQMNRFDDALAALRDGTAQHPREAGIWSDAGNVAALLGREQAALGYLDQALKIDPDHVLAHYNRAVVQLAAGNYAEGFAEWEWRWRRPGVHRPSLPGKAWNGEPLDGKRVLIHGEEGLGDYIQFCRFVPLLAQRAEVTLVTRPEIARLIGTLPGVPALITEGNAQLAAVDYHVSIHSLPAILGTTRETLPGTPYLHADADLTATWRHRLAGLPGRRVGLVWAGNANYTADRHRSLRAEELMPLAATAGVSFVSLQIGGRSDLSQTRRAELNLYDATADLHDLSDTAALIKALDLVIAVDTATAHLAGALGHPVWLLNRLDSDWRWLRGRADSPWYASMRVFQQTEFGDWGAVMLRVRAALDDIEGCPEAGAPTPENL